MFLCCGLTVNKDLSLPFGSSALVRLIITGDIGVEAGWSSMGLAVESNGCVGPLTVTRRFLGEGGALGMGLVSSDTSSFAVGDSGDAVGASLSSSSLIRKLRGD